MGVRFYLNTRSKEDRSEVGVILAALRGNTQIKVSTPLRAKPSQWAPKQQRFRTSVPGAADLNGSLARLKADAERLLLDYPDDDDLRVALRARLGKSTSPDAPSVLDLYERFLAEKRLRYKPSTVQVYEGLKKHLEVFPGTEAPATTVKSDWLNRFAAFLVEQGLQNTTTNKLLSRTRGFLRWLSEHDFIEKVPASSPLPTASNFTVYLSADELARLNTVDLAEAEPRRGHEAARDLFVFAAVTGQRYSDLQEMEWGDLETLETLESWNLRVKKTNVTLEVPLVAPARAIIERRRKKKYPLPRLSNQKANEYLKEVARLASIDAPITTQKMKGGARVTETNPKHEVISTHAARRTFVTLALQSGLPMNELLGYTHNDIKSLQVYAGQDRGRLRSALHATFESLHQGGDPGQKDS